MLSGTHGEGRTGDGRQGQLKLAGSESHSVHLGVAKLVLASKGGGDGQGTLAEPGQVKDPLVTQLRGF